MVFFTQPLPIWQVFEQDVVPAREKAADMVPAPGGQRMCSNSVFSTFDDTTDAQTLPAFSCPDCLSTDRELARHIEYFKAENKILRARIPGQVHSKPAERKQLFGQLQSSYMLPQFQFCTFGD